MQAQSPSHAQAGSLVPSSGSVRQQVAGRFLSGFAVLFLLFDSVGKLLSVQAVLDATTQLGYPTDVVVWLGVTLLGCVITYIIPQTSVLGALLLTGYLGGAVATHVRIHSPLATHVLFPIYVAAFLWTGLLLRQPALRMFLPITRTT